MRYDGAVSIKNVWTKSALLADCIKALEKVFLNAYVSSSSVNQGYSSVTSEMQLMVPNDTVM